MPRRNNGPKLQWRDDRGAYYITWTEGGRSRKRGTGTADRAEAEIILGEWLRARQRKQGPSDPAHVLVTDCLNDYAAEHGAKVTAPRVIGCAIEAMTPYWEGRTVADVTPLTCSRYVDWRGRSINTTRRELAVLQAAINWQFKNARLTRSVAVTLPAKPPSKERWLPTHEAALVLRASRTRKARLYLPLFILLALYTGRRHEAILALRWPQVDLVRGIIDFRKPGEIETAKRRGRVRIPDKLLHHLRRARKRGSELGYVLHIERERVVDGKRVVKQERIKSIKKGFEAACIRAGLVVWKKVREGVIDGAPCTLIRPVATATPHTLKHTAASWLIQSGVSYADAAEFLSTSEKVLRETYAHLHPEHQKTAADALSKRGPRMGA